MADLSRDDIVFHHRSLGESDGKINLIVEWNNVSANAVRIEQSEINKWVEQMIRDMILEEENIQTRVCGDTVVTVFREDEDENYFSVEVSKRRLYAYVKERDVS